MYLKINKHLVSTFSKKIRKFIPIRKSRNGNSPGMNSKGLKKRNAEDEQWFFMKNNPSEEEKREMIAMLAEVGVRILWETYCYEFGGKTFLQKEGGPIGQRPTMAASRIVMQDFFIKYEAILLKAELIITLLKVTLSPDLSLKMGIKLVLDHQTTTVSTLRLRTAVVLMLRLQLLILSIPRF